MSINSRSVEFHQRHAKPHSICFCLFFFFLSRYQRERKKSLPRFVGNWKHRLGLESARAALCKWATCTRQTFLSKTFAKPLNIQKQFEKNVWKNGNDAYSLSIWIQTTINHISVFTFLCFLWQYQRQRKCFLSERELRKALRDTLTRAAWLEPGYFLLVRSEHAHARIILDSSFTRPGSAPIWGGKKGEFRDWTILSPTLPILWDKISLSQNAQKSPKNLHKTAK